MTAPTPDYDEATVDAESVRCVLIVAPDGMAPSLPLPRRMPWPYFESSIDAEGVIAKLATFTPNVDAALTLVSGDPKSGSTLWLCPTGLTNHLAMIDVLSTASFLNEWNLRTGFIEFANPAAALGDLIFQMKQLAAFAIQAEEKLYIESRRPPSGQR